MSVCVFEKEWRGRRGGRRRPSLIHASPHPWREGRGADPPPLPAIPLCFHHHPHPYTPPHSHALVAKRVAPPPAGRGDDAIGHARKVASYIAEAEFYRSVAPSLLALPPGDVPLVARPYLVLEEEEGGEAGPRKQQKAGPAPATNATTTRKTTLVLQDLRPSHPVFPRGGLSPAQLGSALRWLAAFHAAFWGRGGGGGAHPGGGPAPAPAPPPVTPPPLLAQREGTYWHLATRPAELAAIEGDAEWGALAAAAPGMAADLAAGAAGPHGTLVHGDAKAANFCFSADGARAAAFDFQYVGTGLGARDVAYLLCSAGGARQIGCAPGGEAPWLDLYWAALAPRLAARGVAVDDGSGGGGGGGGTAPEPYTRSLLQAHYDLAAADFFRFMAGWGTWGAADAFAGVARAVVARRAGGGERGEV